MVLLAAYKLLLYRLTGQTDIMVGTPVRGRAHAEVEHLIGFFSNLIVLRTQIDGRLSFSGLLKAIRSMCVESFEQQEMPFERILGEISVSRDMSRTPVYQTILSFQDFRETQYTFKGLRSDNIILGAPGTQTDLGVWMLMTRDEMLLSVGYSTELFEEASIRKWMATYEKVLDAILNEDGVPIQALPILTESDMTALEKLNHTESIYPKEKLVHQLFDECAVQMPNKAAVRFDSQSVSYADLKMKTDILARILHSRGTFGKPVGLLVDRSPNMLIGIYGILKAGSAYVPIDPALPAARMHFMLTDAGVDTVVTERHLADTLGDLKIDVVLIDDAQLDVPSGITLPSASPDSPAYIIYTSGSTGKPKGVQVPHRALVNLISSISKVPGVTQDDVILAVTTLSFDVAAAELHVPLIQGGTVVIASKDETADGDLLLRRIREYGVTLIQATPATWRILIAAGWDKSVPLRVISTGEPIPKDLALQLLERSDEVWNLYGPTETTVWSTGTRLQSPLDEITIGRPIDNTQVYILDGNMNPVLPGVVGELYIGGDGVADGYINRPELTAERFIENPFEPGTRLYRTGDLVRLNNRGELVCLGRSDFQVKLRGFRIELGEIEYALASHDAVSQATVTVKEERSGDARLIGYYILVPNMECTQTELRRHMRQFLPEYMIPQILVSVQELPMTPNGKVDKKALPEPFNIEKADNAGYVPPKTVEEKFLVEIWQRILNVTQVSINDNFFDLGGHSLLCMDLIFEIERSSSTRLSPRDILMNSLHQIAVLFKLPSNNESAKVVTPTLTNKEPVTLKNKLLGKLKNRAKKLLD